MENSTSTLEKPKTTYYERNKEKAKERQRKYYAENRLKALDSHSRRYYTKKGYSEEDIDKLIQVRALKREMMLGEKI